MTVEEGTHVNGFGATVVRQVVSMPGRAHGITFDVAGVPDRIIEHASRSEQLAEVGLDVPGLVRRARELARNGGVASVRESA